MVKFELIKPIKKIFVNYGKIRYIIKEIYN